MKKFDFSYINFSNKSYIYDLYNQYLNDPDSVDESWRYFFEGVNFAGSAPSAGTSAPPAQASCNLIERYRKYGHLKASISPVEKRKPTSFLDFSEQDLSKEYETDGILSSSKAKGAELKKKLEEIYCSSIGFECDLEYHPEVSSWIYERIEKKHNDLSKERQIELLQKLYQAHSFEAFIHKRYPGQKRFSLEGNDTLIPMLHFMLKKGQSLGLKQGVMGMAHRGRLNVLTHIMGKEYALMFQEFEKTYRPPETEKRGDVKYHKGYESHFEGNANNMQLYLAANPSHLEAVNPVIHGYARAMQEKAKSFKEVLPIIMHGDAAMAGQGIVYESMQLSGIDGYSNEGSIHIVVNNEIGFTAEPVESRSTTYCTDIAKAFSLPIFHVNAEDPIACAFVGELAIEIRQQFGIDVVIDLIGYRKYGHNETDEPAFTNPARYEIIRAKKPIYELYKNQTLEKGSISEQEITKIEESINEAQERAFEKAKELEKTAKTDPVEKTNLSEIKPPEASIESLKQILDDLSKVPEGFTVHRKVQKLLFDERKKALQSDPNDKLIDWALAEHLAYGLLLQDGVDIRISGEDSIRGTFSHRHAAVYDQKSQEKYFPLQHIKEKKGEFVTYNSCLSEYGVMGFDYGYSLAYSNFLVIWEGQYGDFANTAQVMIDQFVASSAAKWGQNTSFTLYLPHGYEGSGPEHSSARIERYLQLCGDENLFIAHPSTPAQWFHLIRMIKYQKEAMPFIIFTPKALLRSKVSFSSLNDLSAKKFEPVIDESNPKEASKVIFCSGKVYYDLAAKREELKDNDVAIVRIEQLYPYPKEKIEQVLTKYQSAQAFAWSQEEHQNAGAYSYINLHLPQQLPTGKLSYAGRESSASPATGAKYIHDRELQEFLNQAFNKKG